MWGRGHDVMVPARLPLHSCVRGSRSLGGGAVFFISVWSTWGEGAEKEVAGY